TIAKVSRSAVYLWLKDAQFLAALEAGRERQVTDALDLLRGRLLGALTKLRALLDADNPMVVLKAASLLLEPALAERARRYSTLTVKQVMGMQELFLGAVLDSLSELNLDTTELRSRVQQRLAGLLQAGWPLPATLTEDANGHH